MEQEKARLLALRQKIDELSYQYYTLDKPTMSDYEYDMLYRELENIEKAHPEWVTPDSPTQRVGSKISGGFEKYTHDRPMLSLGDVFNDDELREFDRRVRSDLGGEALEYVSNSRSTVLPSTSSMKTVSSSAASPAATASSGKTSPTTSAPSAPYPFASTARRLTSRSAAKSTCLSRLFRPLTSSGETTNSNPLPIPVTPPPAPCASSIPRSRPSENWPSSPTP